MGSYLLKWYRSGYVYADTNPFILHSILFVTLQINGIYYKFKENMCSRKDKI